MKQKHESLYNVLLFSLFASLLPLCVCVCRAANWNLAEPTWTGRMRLVARGNNVSLKLEDKMSGALFANCPVETYPGIAIESVSDSSRYFVIRVLDDNGKNKVYAHLLAIY